LILLQTYFGMLHAIYESNTSDRRMSMSPIEIIKVQSATGKEQNAKSELTLLVQEVQDNPERQGLLDAVVSRHATVPGYFALMLFWDTDPRIEGSLLGISLAQSLKTFGLVDHSVWIET
jgi:hypothetical protein